MGMPAPVDFYTREMVLAIPEDGNRYETVRGELLVTPSPRLRHQVILMRLVEVLSPSSARADQFTRCRLCQAQGVGTCWVVDADAGTVEAWTPEAAFPVIKRERAAWHPTEASAPLEIDLAELFRGA
jgi:Uma2 family endonuclease